MFYVSDRLFDSITGWIRVSILEESRAVAWADRYTTDFWHYLPTSDDQPERIQRFFFQSESDAEIFRLKWS